MEPGFRHRRSPSSDRFLGISSFSPPSTTTITATAAGDELNEDEIFWTGDFTESNHRRTATTDNTDSIDHRHNRHHRPSFPHNSGILAALPESDHQPVLYRKPSVSSSKTIPLIPRPPQSSLDRDYSHKSQSVPFRNYQHSAPVNVPVLSMAMAKERNGKLKFIEVDDEESDDEMLPPHEIVARGSGMSPKTTFSVLEGVGRTLKGRDLRQVRNAVWRKTGFLD